MAETGRDQLASLSMTSSASLRALLLAAAFATTLPAGAATIFGSLKRGGKPLPGVALTLVCGKTFSAGQADARGNYSIAVAGSGGCNFTVDGKATTVQLGNEPTRFDFDVPAGDGPLKPL
jgi:hypothetical protein